MNDVERRLGRVGISLIRMYGLVGSDFIHEIALKIRDVTLTDPRYECLVDYQACVLGNASEDFTTVRISWYDQGVRHDELHNLPSPSLLYEDDYFPTKGRLYTMDWDIFSHAYRYADDMRHEYAEDATFRLPVTLNKDLTITNPRAKVRLSTASAGHIEVPLSCLNPIDR